MELPLDQLKPGQGAVVINIDTDKALKGRLRQFGLVPGTRITCRYRNPWGDVTALELRGTVLAMRTCDLARIRVRR